MSSGIRLLPRARLEALPEALRALGYEVLGPRVEDGILRYGSLSGIGDLPWGRGVEAAPGRWRLVEGEPARAFAWANGPQALKPLVFAPEETLWRSDADGRVRPEPPAGRPRAVLGVRACDLAALALLDAHFLRPGCEDPWYAARRAGLLLVAVHCTHPAATCFCVSTGDGPEARAGHDLALWETEAGWLLEAAGARGAEVLARLPTEEADPASVEAARAEVRAAAARQRRALPGRDLREALFARLDHPRWARVAERCLACGSCTAVCPTCFCHATDEHPALDGTSAHARRWSSCFTERHSYIHGIVLRPDTRARYRQWLTHKLGGWHLQYGRSGCVGCGRCIAWCPAAIDLTEETTAICAGAGEAAP